MRKIVAGNISSDGDTSGLCVHLSAEIRREECGTCTNNPRIKVFACALHCECTLGKPLTGIACCATCGDYHPQPGGTGS